MKTNDMTTPPQPVDSNKAGSKHTIEDLNARIDDARYALIEQEHRFLTIILNFILSLKSHDRREQVAALKALAFYLIPGRTAVIIGTGTFVSILTLLLMNQNNEIVEEQVYFLKTQVYYQNLIDHHQIHQGIVEILYAPSEDSLQEYNEWRHGRTHYKLEAGRSITLIDFSKSHEGPSLVPKYNVQERTAALKRLINITRNKPKKPSRTFASLGLKAYVHEVCAMFGGRCFEKTASADESRKAVLDIENAFLDNIRWPDADMSDLIVHAKKTRFREADLRGVDFVSADFSDANFTNAQLENSNLTGAETLGASFYGADLSSVKILNSKKFSVFNAMGVDSIILGCASGEQTKYHSVDNMHTVSCE